MLGHDEQVLSVVASRPEVSGGTEWFIYWIDLNVDSVTDALQNNQLSASFGIIKNIQFQPI